MGRALGSDTPTVKAPAQTSAPQNTATGSGSRPGSYKEPIESSAPTSPYMIRPAPPGWLK
jgi:hypothetical protein